MELICRNCGEEYQEEVDRVYCQKDNTELEKKADLSFTDIEAIKSTCQCYDHNKKEDKIF